MRSDAWRLAEQWATWPIAALVAMPAIAHTALHWGEANVLRGLLRAQRRGEGEDAARR